MKVTPQLTADFDELPELRRTAELVLRSVVTILQVHGISDVRRIRKTGAFGHPYARDIVRPIRDLEMPASVESVREAAGKAVLDYLETIGMGGLSLELTPADVEQIGEIWKSKDADSRDTGSSTEKADAPKPDAPTAPAAADNNVKAEEPPEREKKQEKENKDGQTEN